MAKHPDIVNWRDIETTDGGSDPGTDALMSASTNVTNHVKFARLGIDQRRYAT